jgi:TolB-like protein/Tfp pilus assembly protein PilF
MYRQGAPTEGGTDRAGAFGSHHLWGVAAGVSAAYRPAANPRVNEAGSGFTPPPHSVAVLPFTNLSGDPRQEYFSDGMTEELINALSQIDGLKVIARTSSFSFKGKDADIGDIARKLKVAAILEGSVRRSGNKVRITAQLINALNGFHIWSDDYDRDLNDVLILQADIATAVAKELQAKLLGDEAPKIEVGGSRNAAAFDAYLRGARAYSTRTAAKDCQIAIAAYTEAIRLDPNYALAFAGRSSAYSAYAAEFATGAAVREAFDEAQADARHAVALAPRLAEAHVALGTSFHYGSFDFTRAGAEYQQARALASGNAQVLSESGRFAVFSGDADAGVADARRAAALDPLNPRSHSLLAQALYFARRYQEAVAAFTDVISFDADDRFAFGHRGLAYYGAGDLQSARYSCERKPDHWATQWCLAVTYDKLGQHSAANAAVTKMKTAYGDAAAYQFATIYAQWGNTSESLEWLERALRLRDPGLVHIKADPLRDPVRKEARFQAVERALKFPH